MDPFYVFEMNKEQVEKIKAALKADKDEYEIFIKSNTTDFVRISAIKDFVQNGADAASYHLNRGSAGEAERMYHEGRRSAFELVANYSTP